jgi:autophagy-related protein 9
MEELVQHTHYMPKYWKGKTNTQFVYKEFTELFEYKIVLFIIEMLSVLFAPLILYFSLANSSERIINFFREFTVNEPGVGDVCKFAVFPLEELGNQVLFQ